MKNAQSCITVSEDGAGLAENALRVSQDVYEAFEKLVEDTKAIEEDDSLTNMDYEAALYNLEIAYGGEGDFHSIDGNIYPDGVGIMVAAANHGEEAQTE